MSLPSRERGLKHASLCAFLSAILVAPFAGAWIETVIVTTYDQPVKSLPSRERGLKQLTLDRRRGPTTTALPSRERGLKRISKKCIPSWVMVAPFAGAWIETRYKPPLSTVISVAPFAGAWIETILHDQKLESKTVAPFAGAWIETIMHSAYFTIGTPSLPSRERGLKPCVSVLNRTIKGRSLRGSVD